MAKPKTIYRCTECGYESAKWNGKCPSCGAWNTLEEDVPLPAQAVGNSRRKSGGAYCVCYKCIIMPMILSM